MDSMAFCFSFLAKMSRDSCRVEGAEGPAWEETGAASKPWRERPLRKGSVAPESGSGRKAAAQSWGAGAQEGWRDLLCLWQELTRARRVGLRVCTLTGLLEAGVGAGGWVLSPQSGELE